MTPDDVVRHRLAAQFLIGPKAAAPIDVVRTLGAVQAQDHAGALIRRDATGWALGGQAKAMSTTPMK